MKFRPVRGGLYESMTECREWGTEDDLVNILTDHYLSVDRETVRKNLYVYLYSDTPDDRIGWNRTYIVTVKGIGPIGFTDGPLREKVLNEYMSMISKNRKPEEVL